MKIYRRTFMLPLAIGQMVTQREETNEKFIDGERTWKVWMNSFTFTPGDTALLVTCIQINRAEPLWINNGIDTFLVETWRWSCYVFTEYRRWKIIDSSRRFVYNLLNKWKILGKRAFLHPLSFVFLALSFSLPSSALEFS